MKDYKIDKDQERTVRTPLSASEDTIHNTCSSYRHSLAWYAALEEGDSVECNSKSL